MRGEDATLILLTSQYPFGIGETFLETEIKYLAQAFKRLIVVPLYSTGEARPLPPGVKLELSLSQIWPQNKLAKLKNLVIKGFFTPITYEELLHRSAVFLHPVAIKRLLAFSGGAKIVFNWFLEYIKKNNILTCKTLVYTYWFSQQTLAAGLLKTFYPDIKVISRIHGGDLYEERHKPVYLPLRHVTFCLVDRVYAISDNGKQYIKRKYAVDDKCNISRLGVVNNGHDAPYSKDGIMRVVSCSLLVPVKRLHLIIQGLSLLAQQYPHQVFIWHHLGDGILRSELERQAARSLPANVEWKFVGQVSNQAVLNFYRENPVDVFINVSSSEGIPVSIMEAMSFGIPVIATAVGGTPEIVNEENGFLLPENTEPHAVAKALEYFLINKNSAIDKRKKAKETWRQKYDARVNYELFANEIRGLL